VLHDFYKALAALRKRNAAIYDGESFILPTEHSEQLGAFLRRKGNELVLVLLNVSTTGKLKITVDHEWLKGRFKNIFSGMEFQFNHEESFELQAGDYLVYEKINE
jgi:glycosidase